MVKSGARGMTLLELTMAMSIFTIVMGAIFGMALSFGDTAGVQEARIGNQDQVRGALQRIAPQLRQAARASINTAALPGEVLTFRVPIDADGNGTAVDVNANIELSQPRTIQRDVNDVNGDGFTATQLVLIVPGAPVEVLANDLTPFSEQLDSMGVLTPENDINGNGRLDQGFWVTSENSGIRVTVQAQRETRRGHTVALSMTEWVSPRN